jgi:hypothetical protein
MFTWEYRSIKVFIEPGIGMFRVIPTNAPEAGSSAATAENPTLTDFLHQAACDGWEVDTIEGDIVVLKRKR